MRFKSPANALFDALERGLSIPQEPRMVRGPEECIYLLRLKSAGKPKQAQLFLQNRAKEIVRFWTNRLGLKSKRGRPHNALKRLLYLYGARLRSRDKRRYSWAVLARTLEPKAFAAHPQQVFPLRCSLCRGLLEGRDGWCPHCQRIEPKL